jgi:hypothetical protein
VSVPTKVFDVCADAGMDIDLAKSLMALDERKDLLNEWDAKDSALEIIFLYVPECVHRTR